MLTPEAGGGGGGGVLLNSDYGVGVRHQDFDLQQCNS